VTILGVGLLGASVARAMKKRSLCLHVTGHGRNEDNLKRAQSLAFIDSYELDPAAACQDADLVVLATPIEMFTGLMEKIAGSLKQGAVLIDVGSVKGSLYRDIVRLTPQGVSFVGCHPIAGGERSGIDASDEDLFEGALCIITDETDSPALGKAEYLWKRLGSSLEYMGADEHDRVYALVSHFPHLAAFALVNTVGEGNGDALRFAGPGFMDTTRIAMSSPELWKNIALMNRDHVVELVDRYIKQLESFASCLRDNDGERLEDLMEKARALRSSINGR
jgi:prephenate dehydrogenase